MIFIKKQYSNWGLNSSTATPPIIPHGVSTFEIIFYATSCYLLLSPFNIFICSIHFQHNEKEDVLSRAHIFWQCKSVPSLLTVEWYKSQFLCWKETHKFDVLAQFAFYASISLLFLHIIQHGNIKDQSKADL